MAKWRVTPFTVADDDRAGEGFDYEVRFDADADRWFVYHGQKLAGFMDDAPAADLDGLLVSGLLAWALSTPGGPGSSIAFTGAHPSLFEAVTAIHDHIGRCDAEREAAEAALEAAGE